MITFKEIKLAIAAAPGKTQLWIYGSVGVIALAAVIVTGVAITGTVSAIRESWSHAQTQKKLDAAEAEITKSKAAVEAANVDRDAARLDAAAANAREAEITKSLNALAQKIERADNRLAIAHKDTNEAKGKYEATKNKTTIDDNRSIDAKRDELRARLANRGVTVEN